MISRTKSKAKATPKQLRRTGYLVAAFAVFVLVIAVYREIDYAGFAETALRTDARIVRIEAIREGKRIRHILHYELDHRGKTYRYSDASGAKTKLEELYTGSFNAFTGDDPPLQVGKTFGVLVNPYSADDHRPDRDKLSLPSALWLAPLLGIVFLSSVAAFLFWAGHEPKGGTPPGPAKASSRNSRVSTSNESGVLRVRATVDVPWPRDGGSASVGVTRIATADIRFELNPDEDAQLYEARVDFLGASGERASETVQRAVQLRAGMAAQLSATLKVPSSARTLRLVLVLADRTTWQHDIALP